MKNMKVASILYEISDLLDVKKENFKLSAYRRAVNTIKSFLKQLTN